MVTRRVRSSLFPQLLLRRWSGCRERMFRAVPLLGRLGRRRLALYGTLDGFLRRLVVVLLDLGVVRSVPMDEHAHADEDVVRFAGRDYPFGDTVLHCLGNRMLRRAEH